MQIQLKFSSENIDELTEIIDFVNKKAPLDWNYISKNISGNPNDTHFINFITKFMKKINFVEISSNKFIKWNNNFINDYSQFLDFEKLSENDSIPFDKKIILSYKEKWNWKGIRISSNNFADYQLGGLSCNPRFPISRDLIINALDKIDFHALGMNSSFIVFNPNAMPDEYWPCNLDQLRMNIIVLMEFWDKWFFKGSIWIDDDTGVHGIKRDSIYDNKSIDWNFIKNIKSYYKKFIIDWTPPEYNDDNELPF